MYHQKKKRIFGSPISISNFPGDAFLNECDVLRLPYRSDTRSFCLTREGNLVSRYNIYSCSFYLDRVNTNGLQLLPTTPRYNYQATSELKFLWSDPGLSLSFEAGVTLKMSPVTCKYIAKGHVNEGPKGLRPMGGLGAHYPRKFVKLDPRKCIFPHSEEQFFIFLIKKVMKIKQSKKINFTMNKDIY